MTAALVLLAGLFGFLGGLWLMRLTRSDTWAVVQDLHRRVSDLELLVDPDELPTGATTLSPGDSRGTRPKETEQSAL